MASLLADWGGRERLSSRADPQTRQAYCTTFQILVPCVERASVASDRSPKFRESLSAGSPSAQQLKAQGRRDTFLGAGRLPLESCTRVHMMMVLTLTLLLSGSAMAAEYNDGTDNDGGGGSDSCASSPCQNGGRCRANPFAAPASSASIRVHVPSRLCRCELRALV